MSPAYGTNLSDEKLVAYIDGELSASEMESVAEALSQNTEARERLAVLERGGRAFGEAFDLLLEAAPEDKLHSVYAELIGKTGTAEPAPGAGMGDQEGNVVSLQPRRAGGGTPFWRMAAAAVILALVFAGGLMTGGFFKEQGQTVAEEPGWVEAVAGYVALFSEATLEGMPSDPQQRQANLERIETALGLPLSTDKITAPDLSFRGTQLLQLKGKPLAQISYLYGGKTPVALCIIRSSNPAAAPAKETRHGLNVVHWVKGGYGYMVIGDMPDAELDRIAQTFEARFS